MCFLIQDPVTNTLLLVIFEIFLSSSKLLNLLNLL
jgi:hypothetical protein